MILPIKITREKNGFEIDYDKYGLNPDRNFSTADDWWRSFCSLGRDEFEQSDIKEGLLAEVNGDVYLAMAINHFVGKNYKSWLDKKGIGVLGGVDAKAVYEHCLWNEKASDVISHGPLRILIGMSRNLEQLI